MVRRAVSLLNEVRVPNCGLTLDPIGEEFHLPLNQDGTNLMNVRTPPSTRSEVDVARRHIYWSSMLILAMATNIELARLAHDLRLVIRVARGTRRVDC